MAESAPFNPRADFGVHSPDCGSRIVIRDDAVTQCSYVTFVLKTVLGIRREHSRAHFRELRRVGRTVVWSGELSRAVALLGDLEHWHVRAELEEGDGN